MMNKREAKFWLESFYPTTFIKDRYNGTYSGAVWLAFPLDFWNVPNEVDGDDVECMMFWESYDGVVGKGRTPELAMANLIAKMQETIDKLHMENFERDFGKKFYGDDDGRAE